MPRCEREYGAVARGRDCCWFGAYKGAAHVIDKCSGGCKSPSPTLLSRRRRRRHVLSLSLLLLLLLFLTRWATFSCAATRASHETR